MKYFLASLLAILSIYGNAQDDYLLDSSSNLLFIPPSLSDLGFNKYEYDSECRVIKEVNELFTTITEYGEGSKTEIQYDTESNLQTKLTVSMYNSYDSIEVRTSYNYAVLYSIDSFFYNDNQALIISKNYRIAVSDKYLYRKESKTYNDDGLILTDSLYYFSPQNALIRTEYKHRLYNENNQLIQLSSYTDAVSSIAIDTTKMTYENGLLKTKEYEQWESLFYYAQFNEYEYFPDKEIEYISTRPDSESPYTISMRIESSYGNDIFFEYDTVSQFNYLDESNFFLAARQTTQTDYNSSEDTAFVRFAINHFESEGNITVTIINKLLYVKKGLLLATHQSPMVDFRLYPNPIVSEGAIRIESEYNFDQIVFLDQLGRTVNSIDTNNQSHKLYQINVPKGMYFVILKLQNRQLSNALPLIVH